MGSTSQSSSKRRHSSSVTGTLLLVIFLHVAGGLLVQAYRHQNLRWHGRDPLDLQLPDLKAPSRELKLQTDSYLERYSELELGERNSRIVSSIKREPPTEWLGDLLKERNFDGWVGLFRYAVVMGTNDDVVSLAKRISALTEDQGRLVLLSLASKHLLTPSAELARAGIFRRALLLFDTYTGVTMEVVRAGSWVSAEGLDLTDLAVINQAFCRDVYRTPLSKCSLSLILAIEPAGSYYLYDFTIPQFGSRYLSSVPQALRDRDLDRYLKGATLLAQGLPTDALDLLRDHPPKGREALAAWLYLQARAELALANLTKKTSPPDQSMAELGRQRLRTIVLEFPESPFAGPAGRKLGGAPNEEQ